MKKCNWCGAELEDDAKSCPKCQALQYEEQTTSKSFDLSGVDKLRNDDAHISSSYYEEKNAMATLLKVIGGLIIAIGVIVGGIIAADQETFTLFLLVGGSSFIFGIMLVAFGEVIYLLQAIKNKMK